MRSGIRRCVYVAFAAAALLVGTGTAQAQTDRTVRVNFDAAKAVAPDTYSADVFAPRLKASFQNNQPQLGPGAEDSGIGFGVLGMITRTSFRADGAEDFFDSRTGTGFGVWVGGNRNGTVGFTGEFIYLIRGDDDFKTKALQIPAVFHINFGSRSRNSVGGYVVVGPSFTINLKQEIGGIDVSDDFNGADIGIIGGVGVEFFRIGIEGRGNWGLRSISNDGDVNDIKTFTFEFLGKFAFN